MAAQARRDRHPALSRVLVIEENREGAFALSESTSRGDSQLATQINVLIIEREVGLARLTPGSASPKE